MVKNNVMNSKRNDGKPTPIVVNLLMLAMLGALVWHVGFPVVAIACWTFSIFGSGIALLRRIRPCKA